MCILCTFLCRLPLTKPNCIPFFFFTIILCCSYIISSHLKPHTPANNSANCFLHFILPLLLFFERSFFTYNILFYSFCKDPYLNNSKISRSISALFFIPPISMAFHLFLLSTILSSLFNPSKKAHFFDCTLNLGEYTSPFI